MKQAKVPTDAEFKRLLAVVAGRRHAARNSAAIHLSYLCGFRVGEIASLKVEDVYNEAGEVTDRIMLSAHNTKTKEARAVFVCTKLRRELQSYWSNRGKLTSMGEPFLMTQKGTSFSANTLCQLFSDMYRLAGISGCSSHSGRRSFISNLSHAGVSHRVIMSLSEHSSISNLQRYVTCTDEMQRNAVEVL